MPFDPATEPRAQNEVVEVAAGERHDEPEPEASPLSLPRTPEERGVTSEPRANDMSQQAEGQEESNPRVQVNLNLDEVMEKAGNLSLLGGLF